MSLNNSSQMHMYDKQIKISMNTQQNSSRYSAKYNQVR